MHKITYIIFFIFLFIDVEAKSPHGESLKLDCNVCHTVESWTRLKSNGFDHKKTKFPLTGQHKILDCRKCHTSLQFSSVKSKCYECHIDVHQGTTGNDCERCHNTNSWIVTNVKSIHQESGFPLIGAHQTADCQRCHTSASKFRFDNIRTDCFACHKDKYYSTVGKPFDHQALGFDTDCAHCHNMTGMNWNSIGKGFDHSFFPLTGSHNIDCNECHKEGNYKVRLSSDCSSCHGGKKNIAAGSYPAHLSVFAKYTCSECHTAQDWNVVKFKQHDGWYGIYSGEHKGKWTKCTDCHTNDANYDAKNNCSRCHSDKRF